MSDIYPPVVLYFIVTVMLVVEVFVVVFDIVKLVVGLRLRQKNLFSREESAILLPGLEVLESTLIPI